MLASIGIWIIKPRSMKSTTLSTTCASAQQRRQRNCFRSKVQRQDLLDEGQSLCSALSACESFTDGLQFFQCYNEASSTKSPTLFNISVTSERIADKLKISYQAINDTERVCTTNARVKNVEDLSVSRAQQLLILGAPTTDDATASTDTTTEATA